MPNWGFFDVGPINATPAVYVRYEYSSCSREDLVKEGSSSSRTTPPQPCALEPMAREPLPATEYQLKTNVVMQTSHYYLEVR